MRSIPFLAILLLACMVSPMSSAGAAEGPAISATPELPFCFVENLGQWPEDVHFLARAQGLVAAVKSDGVLLRLLGGEEGGTALRLDFRGCDASRRPEGGQPQPGRHHFLIGAERDDWRTDARGFDHVWYRDLYPGVDLRLRGQEGVLEYDLFLAPGASLEPVVLHLEGASSIRLDADGSLVAETALGTLRQPPPQTWQEDQAGEVQPVECRYRVLGDQQYGFDIPARDPAQATVIDPSLRWSTFFGGTGSSDRIEAVAVDDQGLVTVAGMTDTTTGFWLQNPFDSTYNGGSGDAFVARLDPAQTGAAQLVWCTYLGGSDLDYAWCLDVVADGSVYVLGSTDSTDFPTQNPFQASFGGGPDDRWVAHLDPALSGANQLLWSSYLGGDGDEGSAGIHGDVNGIVTVGGTTDSTNFPTTANAHSAGPIGGKDLFVVQLDPGLSGAAQLLYGTYIGGLTNDNANDMAVDAAGVVTLAGWTDSAGSLPVVPGSFNTTYGGGTWDGFLLQLDPSLAPANQVIYGTFLGGSDQEGINGLALAADGVCTVTGSVASADFPTTPGACDRTFNGGASSYDGFVTQIDPDLNLAPASQLVYSTYLGGSQDYDYGYKVTLDTTGGITVSGVTRSADFPVTPYAFQSNLAYVDTFVTRLSPKGQGALDLISSTYLGGAGTDTPWEITVDPRNLPVVVGRTGSGASGSFPTTSGALQPSKSLGKDGFITKLCMVSWANYGTGWPGSGGTVPTLTASDYPVLGRTITIDAENSSGVKSVGFLLAGVAETNVPVKRGGTILVDPFLMMMVPIPAAGLSLPWSIPNNPGYCDLDIYLQLLQSDPGAVGKISMSQGLHLILGG